MKESTSFWMNVTTNKNTKKKMKTFHFLLSYFWCVCHSNVVLVVLVVESVNVFEVCVNDDDVFEK